MFIVNTKMYKQYKNNKQIILFEVAERARVDTQTHI